MEELWGAPETAALMKAFIGAVIREVIECKALLGRLERRVKGLSPQKVMRPFEERARVPETRAPSSSAGAHAWLRRWGLRSGLWGRMIEETGDEKWVQGMWPYLVGRNITFF